jgi:hypothetical protein
VSPRRTIVHEFETSRGLRMQLAVATEHDADLVWSWWDTHDVRRNCPVDHRLSRVGTKPYGPGTVDAYLRYCQATGFVRPYLVIEYGVPVAYLETYPAAATALAQHPRIGPGDRGLHMIVDERVRHLGRALEISVPLIDWLFDTCPEMNQLLGDPSVHNLAAQALCRRVGMTELDRVDLGYKQAVIYSVGRAEWGRLRAAAGR